MSDKTGIEWCDSTATPVIGCWPVSPGCANCWARNDTPARVLRAGKWPGHPEPFETWTKDGPRYRVKGFADALRRMNARPWAGDNCGKATAEPEHEKALPPCGCGVDAGYHRRRVFIGDSCDLFDPAWPAEWLAETLWQMSLAPDVVQILCTKRPELFDERMLAALNSTGGKWGTKACDFIHGWKCGAQVPQNVCVLASVENQEMAELRIPALLRIPARWHGLSLEPLLGEIDLELQHGCRGCNHPGNILVHWNEHGRCSRCDGTGHEPSGIDWLILGCESLQGKAGRFAEGYAAAADSLVRQGQAAGVAVFHKQMPVGGLVSGDPQEWPETLRVREWPEGME